MYGLKRIVLVCSLLLVSAQESAASCAAPTNFSGTWVANDGGRYRLVKEGNGLWWLGDGPGDSWVNVFHGNVNGNTIVGDWADLYDPRGSGTLTLKVIRGGGNGILAIERVASSGDGFGGMRWTKPCNDT